MIVGIRKAEGGVRATAYDSCFSDDIHGAASYRPLFWYLDETRHEYENCCKIKHSDCYSVWGFKRTGCCCCPFGGKQVNFELQKVKEYEPKLYNAINNIFGKSYEYQKEYYEFVKEQKAKAKGKKTLF